jgi:periplasmic divalent cation tolerance protein
MKLALTNVPPAVAESMARTLVGGGFAACVSALPGRSTYRWKGELCVDDEVTLVMKVGDAGVELLRKRVLELHPYELPEFVVLAVESEPSSRAYLEWVKAGTTATAEG